MDGRGVDGGGGEGVDGGGSPNPNPISLLPPQQGQQ